MTAVYGGTTNSAGYSSGNQISDVTNTPVPDVRALMKDKGWYLWRVERPSTMSTLITPMTLLSEQVAQIPNYQEHKVVPYFIADVRVLASGAAESAAESIPTIGWTQNASPLWYGWAPTYDPEQALKEPSEFVADNNIGKWNLQSGAGTYFIESIRALKVSDSDYGLTIKDMDVLWMLQTGLIKRKDVANYSATLDLCVYDPSRPNRLPADGKASGQATSTSSSSNPTVNGPGVDLGNGYKGEPDFPTLQQAIKIPLTAAMLGGLVKLEGLLGKKEVQAAPILPALNSGNYAEAVALVNTLEVDGKPIANPEKIIEEMQADGVPSADNSVSEIAYATSLKPYNDPRENPGFSDPEGRYPSIVKEPSTNRLSRNQSISRTIMAKKSSARVTDVRTANGVEWSQPKNPYNAKYPYNSVKMTESGHVEEFDDTPGAERIHRYHRSGTYEEIDRNGTRVNRIVGDDFEILERNGHVLIKGTCNVTIIGNQNIRVEQDANIEVKGDTRLKVAGDCRAGVNGNMYSEIVKDHHTLVGGDMRVKVKGEFSVNAKAIHLNTSGKDSVVKEQTKFPIGTKKNPAPKFSELTVVSSNSEILSNYESPSEGDPSEFIAKKQSTNIEPASKSEESRKVIDSKTGNTKPAAPKKVDNSDIVGASEFNLSFPLSPNFTLKQLTPGSYGAIPTDPEHIENLRALAVNCLEPIKKRYPNMTITSGYRVGVPAGGSKTSDHLTGCAADFVLTGFTRANHRDAIVEIAGMLPAYTQLILEYTSSSVWIHVAYNRNKGARMEQFTMSNHKVLQPMGKYTLVG